MKIRPPLAAYVAGIILGAVVVFGSWVPSAITPQLLSEPEFWIIAFGVVAGEFVKIQITHGRETSVVTVGDPFTLALLFSFGLGPALFVKVIASLLEDSTRHQVWWKALFNASQFTLTMAASYFVASVIGGDSALIRPLEAFDILPTLAAAAVYFFVNLTILNGAISLSQGNSLISSLRNSLKERVINQGTLLGFTPVVMGALDRSVWLFPMLVIPIIVVYHSGVVTHRHMLLADQMKELYEATRTSQRSSMSQDWVQDLLQRVCTMFNATSAVVTLLPREGHPALRTRLDTTEDIFEPWVPTEIDATKGLWARVASEDKAALLAAPITNPRLGAYYSAQGIKDVMAAPLRSEGDVRGVIGVYNRIGAAVTFSKEDLRLFETLANHVSIALENNRLIEELESSLEHLTEMNRLKDDFVASVSHELRTPLTSIRGYVQTLLRADANFEPEDQRSFLETIDRQSSRLHRLIEDLLAVSRIESETDSSFLAPISIRQLMEDVTDELRTKSIDHEIELRLPHDLPMVETDAGKVHQILGNLVDNALKYSPKGTMVVVSGVIHGNGVSISIADQGPGIPSEAAEMIFDRFFQVDQSATRAVGGAGLGLYISRRMAEAIGGRVWLEKSDETGSIFSLWIPMQVPISRPEPASI